MSAAADEWDKAGNEWDKNYRDLAAEGNQDSNEATRRANAGKIELASDLMGVNRSTTGDQDGDQYLWVFVFKNEEDAKYDMNEEEMRAYRTRRVEIVSKMLELGLQVKKHRSRDNDEKFVKVSAAQDVLETLAETLKYKVRLRTGAGHDEFKRNLRHKFRVPKPWTLGSEAEEPPLEEEEHASTLGQDFHFTSMEACQIVWEILHTREEMGGAALDIGAEHCKNDIIVDYFPGHRAEEVEWLRKHWGRLGLLCTAFLSQPIERVRMYFGSQVGLYFTFLGFYTKCLCAPAMAGIYAFSVQMAEGHYDVAEAVPFVAAFMCFWGTLMLEGWKRKQITQAYRWGSIGCEETERARPEFNGTPRLNPITGEAEIYYDEGKRATKVYLALALAFTCTLAVGFGVASVLMFRYFMMSHVHASAGAAAGIINGIMIAIFNTLYRKLAVCLTDWENHKTQTSYDDSLILKSFMFQFFNSYTSFYVVAFIKPYGAYFNVADLFGNCTCADFNQAACTEADILFNNTQGQCPGGETENCVVCACQPQGYSCIDELATLLISIFGVQLFVGNFMEFMVPYIKMRIAMWKEGKEVKKKAAKKAGSSAVTAQTDQGGPGICEAEVEAKLEKYESPFEDYNELILQYGFVSLFAAAFPLCALLALMNNIVEIRSDANKLLKVFQRPVPRNAEDIGSWYYIMDIMTYLCIMTNCAIVFFTSHMAATMSADARIWGFILAEHMIIVVKAGMMYVIPDKPTKTHEAMERDDYRHRMDDEAAHRDQAIEFGSVVDNDFYEEDDPSDVNWMQTSAK